MSSNSDVHLKCPHLCILSDNDEGNAVCTECGEVLDAAYGCSQTYIQSQTSSEKELYNGKINKMLDQRKEEIELIKTLEEKWFFPPAVISSTIELFLELIERKQLNVIKVGCYKKTIFAFAFYKSLSKHNCSRSISEICNLFDITSLKKFSQLGFEKEIELPLNVTDFLNRFCSNLEFNFKERKNILQILQNIKLLPDIKTETICALIILHYHYTNSTKWSTKEIAIKCEITYQTMIKNYSYFKHIFY